MRDNVKYTDSFVIAAEQYIHELIVERKEILDSGKDTADDTDLPDIDALADDAIFFGADEGGLCYNYWAVTDRYDSNYPFVCRLFEKDGITILDATQRTKGSYHG